MHPDILRDLVKAHTSDLHRQAERGALSLAARRARHASAKQGTPFMPAHTTAEFIRRVLTLLGARKRSLQKFKMAPIWARRRRLPRVSLAFCGVLSAALAAVVLVAAIASDLGESFKSGGYFGGMSGVVFAVAGYLWIKGHADPDDHLSLDQRSVNWMLGWFLLGVIAPVLAGPDHPHVFPYNMANVAHGAIKRADATHSESLASIARVAILGLVIAMGLRAMGIADDIVNLAFLLTFGAVAVAVALSFGLGGREAAGRQMEYWLAKLRKDG